MPRRWITNALAFLAVGICLLVAGLIGLWTWTGTTAAVLHPDPAEVPAVTLAEPTPAWADAVRAGRQLVRTHLSMQNLPGLSVAVGIDGDLVWAEGFGWSNVDERTRVTPETMFRIGTASTVLTSAAVGLLLERDRLRLDDEIQVALPAFPRKPWPVTLQQIMGHVAGLRDDGGDEAPLLAERCTRPLEAFPHFVDRPLLTEPGTQFHPSNYGWIVVSAAIEAAAGEPVLRFMRKRIFEPLRMDDTRPDEADETMPERAVSYFPRFAADPRYGLDLNRDIDLSCYAGAGALLSTPSDLVRFGLAVTDGTLLTPATVATLQTAQRLASGDDTGYGLGWDVEQLALGAKQVTTIGHDGDLVGGEVASLLTVPEHGLVIAVASNSAYASTSTLASGLAQAFGTRPHQK